MKDEERKGREGKGRESGKEKLSTNYTNFHEFFICVWRRAAYRANPSPRLPYRVKLLACHLIR
jgi:hypothetical protein